jgi:hypothetical protein
MAELPGKAGVGERILREVLEMWDAILEVILY